jgi:hypothetical protein
MKYKGFQRLKAGNRASVGKFSEAPHLSVQKGARS